MEENERSRILNMLKEGKITTGEAESLLDALDGRAKTSENVSLKDNRGRKPNKLKVNVLVDSGTSGLKNDAKVNISIPVSLIRTIGPMVANNMPKEAKEKLGENGVDLNAIFSDVERMLEEGLEEDIVNIDADDGKSKVRIYVE